MNIIEMDLDEFTSRYVYDKRRRFLFERFRDELEILNRNCFAYQMLIIGSFLKDAGMDKNKPGDIDVYLRAYLRPSRAEFLPKHLKKRTPIIPFHDYDNFCDITSIEPVVTDTPVYISFEEMMKVFNQINNFQLDFAVAVKQFQRTPLITTLTGRDRTGQDHHFIVEQEQILHEKFEEIEFRITQPGLPYHKHFIFSIVHLKDGRILIYRVDNNFAPELTGKGIVKAMITALSEKYKKIIVSSTNKDELKIDAAEGRVQDANNYWNKWLAELDNVSFIAGEDRFAFTPQQ